MTNVKTLEDQELVNKLKFLIGEEKKNVAAQIVLLKEFRQRQLAVSFGYPSLFAFCEQELGLSKDQAWKRSQAASTIEKAPEFLTMLKTGETSMTTLAIVAPKLSEKTCSEIMAFVPNKSKREVEAFVSNLNRDGSRIPRPQTIKLQLEVSLETSQALNRAKKLMRQNKNEITDDHVLKLALNLLLDKKDPQRQAVRAQERLQRKQESEKPCDRIPTATFKATAPHKATALHNSTSPGQGTASLKNTPDRKRYIPATIKHELHASQDYRCQYVGSTGKRCCETAALQMDHKKMFCHGGDHVLSNLRLLCAAHNRFAADRVLGKNYRGST